MQALDKAVRPEEPLVSTSTPFFSSRLTRWALPFSAAAKNASAASRLFLREGTVDSSSKRFTIMEFDLAISSAVSE
jgi:hypothetical protein